MADLDPADQAVTVASVREEDGTPVVYLSGELDLTNAGQLSAAIDAALGSYPGRLVLDASGLTFIDSSGIVLLVSATQRVQEVQVRDPSPIVRRLIELTGLSKVLRITS
jgi:anti-sigma B factor antagonist